MASVSHRRRTRRTERRPLRAHRTMTAVQLASLAIGVVFALVGIAGFIPGLTTNVDRLQFAGSDTGTQLLGLFAVSVLHNLVHLGFGVAGIALSRSVTASKLFLIGGGGLYLALTLYGAGIDRASNANFLPFNTADNWLHLGLGLGMAATGFVTARISRDT